MPTKPRSPATPSHARQASPRRRERWSRKARPRPRRPCASLAGSRWMPDFDYLAIDTRGGERRGSLVAPSLDDARAKLDQRRLYVVRIEPGSGVPKPTASLLSFTRRKLTAKELTLFTRQIATL